MDDDQLGEFAYDYVEVRRDYLAWTPEQALDIDTDTKEDRELRSPMSRRQLIEGRNPNSMGGGGSGLGMGMNGDIEMVRMHGEGPFEGVNGVGNIEDAMRKKA